MGPLWGPPAASLEDAAAGLGGRGTGKGTPAGCPWPAGAGGCGAPSPLPLPEEEGEEEGEEGSGAGSGLRAPSCGARAELLLLRRGTHGARCRFVLLFPHCCSLCCSPPALSTPLPVTSGEGRGGGLAVPGAHCVGSLLPKAMPASAQPIALCFQCRPGGGRTKRDFSLPQCHPDPEAS